MGCRLFRVLIFALQATVRGPWVFLTDVSGASAADCDCDPQINIDTAMHRFFIELLLE